MTETIVETIEEELERFRDKLAEGVAIGTEMSAECPGLFVFNDGTNCNYKQTPDELCDGEASAGGSAGF